MDSTWKVFHYRSREHRNLLHLAKKLHGKEKYGSVPTIDQIKHQIIDIPLTKTSQVANLSSDFLI